MLKIKAQVPVSKSYLRHFKVFQENIASNILFTWKKVQNTFS